MYYWFWQNGDLIRRKIWISESVSSGVIMCQWDFGKRLVCPIQLSWLAIQRLNALPHQRCWSNFLLELFQIFIGCHPLSIQVLKIDIFENLEMKFIVFSSSQKKCDQIYLSLADSFSLILFCIHTYYRLSWYTSYFTEYIPPWISLFLGQIKSLRR